MDKEISEKQIIKSYKTISDIWIKEFNELNNKPISPKYLVNIVELISKDFEMAGTDLLKRRSISFETHLEIRNIVLLTYVTFLKVRAISCSLWLDKHGNFLDRLIGARDINIPDISRLIKWIII